MREPLNVNVDRPLGSPTRWMVAVLMLVVVSLTLLVSAGGARAQGSVLGTYAFEARWLEGVGALSHNYNAGGAEPEPAMVGEGYTWPAHVPRQDNHRGNGVTLATTDWTDPNGKTWDYKVSHIGMRPSGLEEHFPQKIEQISRFEPPEVTVDGFESFRKPTFNDRVNPDMKADRMIRIVFNNFFGLRVDKKAMQFSNAYHDDYHVVEWTVTNTGNIDGDPNIEKPDQTLTGVYLSRQYLPYMGKGSYMPGMWGAGWGQYNMRDVVGDGLEDYEVDMRATYEWAGKKPGFDRWNNIGNPAITDEAWTLAEGDSSGRLLGAYMIGSLTAFASEEPTTNPPGQDGDGQPTTTTYVDIESPLAGASGFNEGQMRREYKQWIAAGHTYPHHADRVACEQETCDYSWNPERMANQTAPPDFGGGGRMILNSYGPYTMEPGESFKIVEIRGLAGLSDTTNEVVGRQYKQNWREGNPTAPIEFDADGDGTIQSDERMRKNLWVMTTRDSLFSLFRKAQQNYESGYDIAQPPRPPSRFAVTGLANEIKIEWETYSGHQPAQGWELYRAPERVESTPEKEFDYELIAGPDELGPAARSYSDTDVTRGIGYFYYLQAVGEVNQDGTAGVPTGVRLKSNRYYTQTYDPARLKRPPGESLSEVKVVPNPYHLGSEENVRWPDRENQIGFLEVPGQCTITIYTELGEKVETIEHTDGSGDEFWDLHTSSEQLIVTGVYLAVIEDHKTGEQITKKVLIVR